MGNDPYELVYSGSATYERGITHCFHFENAAGKTVATAYGRNREDLESLLVRLVDCANACEGLGDPAVEIPQLREGASRGKALSNRHWTCNKCGGSWNCDRADEPKVNGDSRASIPCPYCELAILRAEIADIRAAFGNALALDDCPTLAEKARKCMVEVNRLVCDLARAEVTMRRLAAESAKGGGA